MNHAARIVTAAIALAGASGAASAAQYVWDWNLGDPGAGAINNAGGTFESVHAEYNTNTKMFHWSTTFSDQVTEGFTLAVSGGPNPKGHAGELALIYFDASNLASPEITAYAYNGKNSASTYYDGNGNVGGNQPYDLIMDVNKASWIQSISAVDNAGKRTLSFTINASDVNGHSPMYPDMVDPWAGLAFGEQLGLWMHPYRNFDPTYGMNGEITSLNASNQGWFDGHSYTTTPTPGSLALASAGGLLMIKRRRK